MRQTWTVSYRDRLWFGKALLVAYSILGFIHNVARQRQYARYSRLQRKQRDLSNGNLPEMYRETKSHSFDLLKGHRRKAPTCSRTAFGLNIRRVLVEK